MYIVFTYNNVILTGHIWIILVNRSNNSTNFLGFAHILAIFFYIWASIFLTKKLILSERELFTRFSNPSNINIFNFS